MTIIWDIALEKTRKALTDKGLQAAADVASQYAKEFGYDPVFLLREAKRLNNEH